MSRYTKRELKWTRLKLKNMTEYADMMEEAKEELLKDNEKLNDAIEELNKIVDKLKKQLNAKIMFVNNGMEEEHYALQEKVLRYEKALKAYGDEEGKIILRSLEGVSKIQKQKIMAFNEMFETDFYRKK